MTSPRRVDKHYSVHVKWFKDHSKEMQFFIGDYLAKNLKVREEIAKPLVEAKQAEVDLLKAELRLWKPKPTTKEERNSVSYKIAKAGIKAESKKCLRVNKEVREDYGFMVEVVWKDCSEELYFWKENART